jgi:hypothetical protein
MKKMLIKDKNRRRRSTISNSKKGWCITALFFACSKNSQFLKFLLLKASSPKNKNLSTTLIYSNLLNSQMSKSSNEVLSE